MPSSADGATPFVEHADHRGTGSETPAPIFAASFSTTAEAQPTFSGVIAPQSAPVLLAALSTEVQVDGISAPQEPLIPNLGPSGGSSAPVLESATIISGQIVDRGDSFAISIQRVDDGGSAIALGVTTWILVHGNDSSPSTFNNMLADLQAHRPDDQILTLDWSAAADNGDSSIFDVESRIPLVGAWAATALADYGFAGGDLNLIGHSFGAYVSSETARLFGGIDTLVALDPARDVFFGFNPGSVDFAADTGFSWAFHAHEGFDLGHTSTPTTADEAFLVDGSGHSPVIDLFGNLLTDPTAGQHFQLSRLLAHTPGVWPVNQFDHEGDAGGGYEAIITTTSGGTVPVTISPAPPEIVVAGNGTEIVDGATGPAAANNTDFGIVRAGATPVTRTFTVTNTGSLALVVGAPALPDGFVLAEGLTGSLAAAVSDTFQVRMDTTEAGERSGELVIATNDSDEDPFSFAVLGVVVDEIETAGDGDLLTSGIRYYIDDGNGPAALTRSGDAVGPGSVAQWSAIQAESGGTGGFNVLWERTNGDYAIWTVTAGGVHTGDSYHPVATHTPELVGSFEEMFAADLDGDGFIGAMLESEGALMLRIVDGQYRLTDGADIDIGLTRGGNPYGPDTVSQWQAIHAEPDGAGGFSVLWQRTNGDLAWWSVDAAGAYLSDVYYPVSGHTTGLIHAIETAFAADLDDDGHAGPAPVFALTTVDNLYRLTSDRGLDIALTRNDTPYGPDTVAQWGATHLAANRDGDGYLVLWQRVNGDYAVWSVDATGAYIRDDYTPVGQLTQEIIDDIEMWFGIDLDDNDRIGPPPIEEDGDLSLLVVAGDYRVIDDDGPDVWLSRDGTTVGPGSIPQWSAIHVERDGEDGFRVLWERTNGDLATWTTNDQGRHIRDDYYPVGVHTTELIEDLEVLFATDLDGNDRIGPVPVVIENDGDVALSTVAGRYRLGDGATDLDLTRDGNAVGPETVPQWEAIHAEDDGAGGYRVLWERINGDYAVWQVNDTGAKVADTYLPVGDLTDDDIWELEEQFETDLDGDLSIGGPIA